MSEEQKKAPVPVLAQWLEPECTVDNERSVGVTVARKVSLNRIAYEGAVTVELFGALGRYSNRAIESDWPETWSGDESATLTPAGARRLAHILNVAADTADAHRRTIGIADAETPAKKSAVEQAVADAVAAEIEAFRAELSRRIAQAQCVSGSHDGGLVAGPEIRSLGSLVKWLDVRSKGGAE